VVGPAEPPPTSEEKETPKNNRASSNAPMGTMAFLSSMTQRESSKEDAATREPKRQKQQPRAIEKPVPTVDNGDEKKDVWQAPKDQDGSGSTKLNLKFAGRY
jgi:hypothetical protein